jgi:protease stability complex PrcB-like protein
MRHTSLVKAAILAAAAGLCACSSIGIGSDRGSGSIDVSEVRRLAVCNSQGSSTELSLFPDATAVADWQKSRGIDLIGAEPLPSAWVYVLIELGTRDTTGYGLAVSRAALLSDGNAKLNATFFAPAPDDPVTSTASSPCVLVALPPGSYHSVQLSDPSGTVRATLAGISLPDTGPPDANTPSPVQYGEEPSNPSK